MITEWSIGLSLIYCWSVSKPYAVGKDLSTVCEVWNTDSFSDKKLNYTVGQLSNLYINIRDSRIMNFVGKNSRSYEVHCNSLFNAYHPLEQQKTTGGLIFIIRAVSRTHLYAVVSRPSRALNLRGQRLSLTGARRVAASPLAYFGITYSTAQCPSCTINEWSIALSMMHWFS